MHIQPVKTPMTVLRCDARESQRRFRITSPHSWNKFQARTYNQISIRSKQRNWRENAASHQSFSERTKYQFKQDSFKHQIEITDKNSDHCYWKRKSIPRDKINNQFCWHHEVTEKGHKNHININLLRRRLIPVWVKKDPICHLRDNRKWPHYQKDIKESNVRRGRADLQPMID